MFYMPKYHNLPDGRQVFLRFPDPVRHARPVSQLLEGIPREEAAAQAYLTEANAHPMRLVLVAEIAGAVAGCGLLDLDASLRQAAVAPDFQGLDLETLIATTLTEVAAQKGVEL